MSKEDPEIKYTGYTEGDIKIKNEEELEEAKKAAGVTTHEKVQEKFAEEEGQEKLDEIEWKKLYEEDFEGYKQKVFQEALKDLNDKKREYAEKVLRSRIHNPISSERWNAWTSHVSGNYKEDIKVTKERLAD